MTSMRKKKKFPSLDTIEFDFTEEDLEGSFDLARGLWLGKFTPEQLIADLESHQIFSLLAERGYTDLNPQIDCHGFESSLVITGIHVSKQEPQLLVEVHARLTRSQVVAGMTDRKYSSLVFDWILFQDPCAEFKSKHPRLPGQRYPGLHLFELGTQLMLDQIRQLDVDLVLNHPQHFHNAVFYSAKYRFLDPLTEGHFLALQRDILSELTLADASRALDEGKVVDSAGRPVVWKQNAQAWPRDEKIRAQLFGADYHERVERASQVKFTLQA